MNSVKSYGTSAQRVFALFVMLGAGYGATPFARAEGVPRVEAAVPGGNSSIVELLWDQSVRFWIEMLRRRVLTPIPPASASMRTLMLGTIDCFNSGGFPTYAPGEAPLAYLETLKNLYDLSLTPPDSIDPRIVDEFRAVLVAAGGQGQGNSGQ